MDNNGICGNPFFYGEIDNNGEVYPCCPPWCNFFSFGNILEKPFNEIWYGEKATNFRRKILEGDYSLCNKDLCTYNNCIMDQDEANLIKEKYINSLEHIYIPEIKIGWDEECNVACITCRDEIKRNKEKNYELFEKINKNLYSYIKEAKIIHCSGHGDPFASTYCRNLIKDIVKINPQIKFGIHTNGILATEKMFEELGIKDKIHKIEISIHAATKKTYDKIVKYGDFNKVIDNITWLSRLNKKKPFENFILTFVINNYNFHEIPNFIKFAEKFGAQVCFYYFRYWNTKYGKGEDFNKIAVWKPQHPKFKSFIKIINNPVVKNCNFYYHTDFMNLIESGIEPKEQIIEKFFKLIFQKDK